MRHKVSLVLATAAVILPLLGLPSAVHAQVRTDSVSVWVPGPTELQQLVLIDGSEMVGRVTDDGDPVRFELVSGAMLEIRREQILSLQLAVGELRDGRLWRPDPSSNRMFFGPTGRTIDAGEGYFAVFELFFPAVGFGITDHFSIAGGTLLLGGFGGDRPFWIIPKLQIVDQETFDFSVGALAISTLSSDFGSVGILFGTGTVGSENAAFTFGAGWGYVDDDLASTPVILLGAETRVSRNMKLMTENYLIPDGDGGHFVLFSAGPRFLGERLSADVALALATDSGDGAFFPLVNFVWSW